MRNVSNVNVPEQDLQKEGDYTVSLSSVGNPDRGQDPSVPVYGVLSGVVNARSIADAAKKCAKYISENDLGGGNWSGGEVKLDGQVVAYISYNGRAWLPEDASKKKESVSLPKLPKERVPLFAIVVGNVQSGFSLDLVGGKSRVDAAIEGYRSAGRFAEAIPIKDPAEVRKKYAYPLQEDSCFVIFSSGFSSGVTLYGPFPEDGEDAMDFGEDHRESSSGQDYEVIYVEGDRDRDEDKDAETMRPLQG